MAKFRQARSTFLAYREGRATFDDVYRVVAEDVAAIAAYFGKRWRCRLHASADIRQEITIAIWRALDEWDPTRGVEIDAYVYFQVGRYAEKRLAKAAGWPRKGRRPPARAVTYADTYEPGAPATQEATVSLRLALESDPWFARAAVFMVETDGNLRGAARNASTSSDDRSWEFERAYRAAARRLQGEVLEAR
jgi:hypothetical protein